MRARRFRLARAAAAEAVIADGTLDMRSGTGERRCLLQQVFGKFKSNEHRMSCVSSGPRILDSGN